MEEAFLSYRFNDAAQTVYEYFWNDFCDWYVEATKLSMKGSVNDVGNANIIDIEKDRAATVLLDVLEKSLRLLHPLLPYVTEEIYSKLPNVKTGELLITAPYPVYEDKLNDENAEREFGFLKELIRQVRTLRSECTIPPEMKLRATVRSPHREGELKENADLIKLLAGLEHLEFDSGQGKPPGSIGLAGNEFEAFVFIAEAADMKLLREKFTKELEKDRKYIESLKGKLANDSFLRNAPPELVAEEKLKLEECVKKTGKIESYIRDMA
jgi:valyl-tRNA synthetase